MSTKNLMFVVGAKTEGYQKAMAEVQKSLDLVKNKISALTDVQNALQAKQETQRKTIERLTAAYLESAREKGFDAAETVNLQNKLAQAELAAARLAERIERNNQALEKAKQKEQELVNSVRTANSALESQGDTAVKTANKLKNLGDKLENLGTKMSVAVSLPAAMLGKSIIQASMDAAESENLFEVSMGEMADAAREWSEEVSAALNLNQYEVRKNVGTFNVMLKSMGLTTGQAYNMSTALTKLAYDMASFYNLRPEEAFEKLRSGITGEIEPLKALGIVINETNVKQWAYKNGVAAVGSELTEQQKVIARYGLIMDSTKTAQGDLARTSNSLANSLKGLEARWEVLKITLGQDFQNELAKLARALTRLINTLLDMSPTSRKVLMIFIGLAAVIGPLTIGVSLFIQAIVKLIEAWKWFLSLDLATKFVTITKGLQELRIATVAQTIATRGLAVATLLLDGALAILTSPIIIIIGLLAALGVAIYEVHKHWDRIQAAWDWGMDWLLAKILGFIDAFERAWSSVAGFFGSIWDSLVATIENAFDKIKSWINKIIEKINSLIEFYNTYSQYFAEFLGLPSIKMSKIPLLASGGTVVQSGLAIVGERGPELLSLPAGAQVIPLNTAGKIEHSGTITVKGVTSKGELVGVVKMLMKEMRLEAGLV